jgi:hypothetical protein
VDITVRTDQMLPTRIERRSADRQLETVETAALLRVCGRRQPGFR